MGKSRLVIMDSRCREEAYVNMLEYAENIYRFSSVGVTYESISCHPDIFIYQDKKNIVVAPNSPAGLLSEFKGIGLNYLTGRSKVGFELNSSCYYNCVSTETHFFHRRGFTDEILLQLNYEKHFVALPQSYTRCSLFSLDENVFMTSDMGILKVMREFGFEVFYFSPSEIKIFGHRNGFLGGTCGTDGQRVYFLGNPLEHADGASLVHFVESHGYGVVSLCNGPLYDGGGVFML